MWSELWAQHMGKLLGAAGGLFLGLIYLICGFWDMLIVAFLVCIGFYIGYKIDRKETVFHFNEYWRRWFDKWNMFR